MTSADIVRIHRQHRSAYRREKIDQVIAKLICWILASGFLCALLWEACQ